MLASKEAFTNYRVKAISASQSNIEAIVLNVPAHVREFQSKLLKLSHCFYTMLILLEHHEKIKVYLKNKY